MFCLLVILSDEKKWNLDKPDYDYRHYLGDLRNEAKYFSKRNFGRGSLMVWRTISLIGCLELQFPSTLMNSTELLWWSAWSPDMNIVEKIWGILMCKVYSNNRQFTSVEDFKLKIIKEW